MPEQDCLQSLENALEYFNRAANVISTAKLRNLALIIAVRNASEFPVTPDELILLADTLDAAVLYQQQDHQAELVAVHSLAGDIAGDMYD